jgi:RNA polymerase sigma-70 factor, ECF subfamily
MHGSQTTIQINTPSRSVHEKTWTIGTYRSRVDTRSSVRDGILANVPNLRGFAISLSGNVDRADDLVQEALVRALANINSFEPGTNLSAWLLKILRNAFLTEYRKRRREVEDSNGQHAQTLKTYPEQYSHIDLKSFRTRLRRCQQVSVRR